MASICMLEEADNSIVLGPTKNIPWALQALNDLLEDDEDIAAMYLTRKAAAKAAAAAHAEKRADASRSASQDDELLVADAEVHMFNSADLLTLNCITHFFSHILVPIESVWEHPQFVDVG